MSGYTRFAKKLAILPAIPLALTFVDRKKAEAFFWSKKSEEVVSGDVYIWGNGYYQARPDSKSQFSNFFPKKITHAQKADKGGSKIETEIPQFTDLIFSPEEAVAVDKAGKLWRFDNRRSPSFTEAENADNFVFHDKAKLNKDNILNNLTELPIPAKIAKIVRTKRLLWILSDKGELYSLPFEKVHTFNMFTVKKEDWKKLATIKDLKDISAGEDHLLMLSKKGEVFSMGSDTFGQCGLGELGRNRGGNFVESRVPNPERIPFFEEMKIDKIFAKANHSLVMTADRQAFGFGSNNVLQLAHEEEYNSLSTPSQAFFSPIGFGKYLDAAQCELQDITLGKDFSIFLCKNRETKLTQVFGCGKNSNGQLGNGRTKHISEFGKVELLSDFTIKEGAEEKPLQMKKITCGDKHCLAWTNVGALLVWGDNEYGQLGNKKRSYSEKPLIVSAFKDRNILDVKADGNSTYVLTEAKKEDNKLV